MKEWEPAEGNKELVSENKSLVALKLTVFLFFLIVTEGTWSLLTWVQKNSQRLVTAFRVTAFVSYIETRLKNHIAKPVFQTFMFLLEM